MIIDVESIDFSVSPAYAKVSVYSTSCPSGSCHSGCTSNADCVSQHSCASGICNTDGTCSFDKSQCLSSTLRMEVLTDYYPEDTTWEVTDECNGGAVVMSGGPYNLGNNFYVDEKAVKPSNYTVRVYDSWGDGVCCYSGWGNIKATLDGTEILSGGDFGSSMFGSLGSC